MDLRTCFKDTIAALDKKEQDLSTREANLGEQAITLQRQAKELQEAVSLVEAEKRAVSDIRDVKTQKEANEQLGRSLQAKEIALKQEENRLKKYENQLFEIKNRQDEQDSSLRERELALAERERTYKEELQKNFAENFASKLLNK